MFKCRQPLFCSLSIAFLFCLLIPSVNARNYIQNSGFESGSTHWNWEVDNGAAATCAVDSKVAHWEGHSLQFTGAGELSQTITGLTPGKTYYARLWCRAVQAGGRNTLAAGTRGRFHSPLPAGTYDWKRIGLTFVADAPAVPLRLRVQGKSTALWVDDVTLTAAPCTDARTLGITGDGITDVTKTLTDALRAHPFLYLPAGTYVLSAPVTVPSNVILWGDGDKTILKQQSVTAPAFLTGASTDTVRLRNVEVSGIRFAGPPSRTMKTQQNALTFSTVEGLLVRNCSAQYCGLLVTTMYRGGYGDVKSEDILSKQVRAVYNDVEATAADFSPTTGMNLSYTVDADVSHNTIMYYVHGIMWWGGDSNPAVDGPYANPRWVRRVLIADNKIAHIGGGGIWGSNGAFITITHNYVRDCGDLGIDFEGCFDSIADSNTVVDGHNGGLASFVATANLTFSHNDVTSTNPAWLLFRLDNSTHDASNVQNMVVSGNRFHATTGIGKMSDASGPGDLKVIGNTFTNVSIDLTRTQTGAQEIGPTITGNTLTFDADTPDALTAIDLAYEYGNCVISGNTIRYAGASQANKTGIKVRKLLTRPGQITISGNTVTGFGAADISVTGLTGSAATINSNTVQPGIINVVTASGLTAIGNGNKDPAGAAVSLTQIRKNE